MKQTLNISKSTNWAFFDKHNNQHMNILSLARQADWNIPHDKYGEVVDLKRLSDFLKSNKCPIKKPLKDMETKELSKVIVALEGIVNHVYS